VTVLVGVLCSDGAVIGADGISTSAMGQFPLIHLESNPKIEIFGNAVIIATTGPVGYAQRLHHHIDLAVKGGVFKNFSAREATNNISDRFITELQKSKAPSHPQEGIGFGGLMAAAPGKEGPFLAEFATTNFQPEMKIGKTFFASMGSGQMLADPFLAFVCRVLWKNQMPTVDNGKCGVYWVLAHTIKLAPGRVGLPICLATLRKIDAAWVAKEEDTQESAQYVDALEEHIGGFEQPPIEEAKAEPVPKPEPDDNDDNDDAQGSRAALGRS
jgi:hypothetical protein